MLGRRLGYTGVYQQLAHVAFTMLWNNNFLKGVAIWAHGPESGCDTGDVCYTREAHGLREKYSRET